MDELAKTKLMDDYLLNRLSAEERRAFEKQLESDIQLKEELTIRSVMVDQIETLGDLKMKDRILKIQSKVEAKPKVTGRRRFLTIGLAVAASILLLLIGNRLLNQEATPADLYAQHYSAYDLKIGDRSTDQDKTLIEGGALYRQGEYAQALPIFEQLQQAGNGNPQVTLAIAICQMELKNYEQAISILEQTSAQKSFLYEDQAMWYRALAHLRLNQLDQAKILLQGLSESLGFKSKESTELLEELK